MSHPQQRNDKEGFALLRPVVLLAEQRSEEPLLEEVYRRSRPVADRKLFSRSKLMRLISPKMHGLIDYIVGLLLLVAPYMFGFATGDPSNGCRWRSAPRLL
jgi:hypothetical protein